MKKFKGDLKGFPEEIVDKMLDYQAEQVGERDVSVFEKNRLYSFSCGGFKWGETEEGWEFWFDVLENKNFDVFFEKYPKKKQIMLDSVCKPLFDGDKYYWFRLDEESGLAPFIVHSFDNCIVGKYMFKIPEDTFIYGKKEDAEMVLRKLKKALGVVYVNTETKEVFRVGDTVYKLFERDGLITAQKHTVTKTDIFDGDKNKVRYYKSKDALISGIDKAILNLD